MPAGSGFAGTLTAEVQSPTGHPRPKVGTAGFSPSQPVTNRSYLPVIVIRAHLWASVVKHSGVWLNDFVLQLRRNGLRALLPLRALCDRFEIRGNRSQTGPTSERRLATVAPPLAAPHFTSIGMLSEWLLNSGAYMHWISATPLWYAPRSCTRAEYSNT